MGRWFAACSLVFGVVVAPASTWAATCKVSKYVDIPVTMTARRPIVTAKINGRDARFILDSGAFFSTIARANAQEFGLPVSDLGNGARLTGIGGDTSLSVTTARELSIAGIPIPHIQFAVGGSDTGYAGLLGQNILGLADVEYDLPHGIVRLLKSDGCRNGGLAYWAGTKPFTLVQIDPMDARQRHTIGTVTLNGVKLKAMFDTGAANSTVTLAAAKRLGVKPGTPGVTPAGFAHGLGQKLVPAWRARFDKIDIGGEAISKPWLEIADNALGPDMLIGIDFFLTHRIYVDNQSHRMFITYEGGPLFGLNPNGAVDDRGAALDLTDKAGEPTDAAGYSRRGAILASSGKLDRAIADFDKAVAMAPGDARYILQRGTAHLRNGQPLLGASDIDKAIELAPTDGDARLTRAQLRLAAHDPAGASTDLHAADQALAPSSDARLWLGSMYDAVDDPARALPSFDQWLKSHPEDSSRAVALNGRCWSRALLDQDLDKAASDCDAAIKLRPGQANALDSRGLVRLRQGAFDKALADYDAALALQPHNAWSLYARSIVERRTGKTAAADTDRAAAIAINPRVVERAKRYGLDTPSP